MIFSGSLRSRKMNTTIIWEFFLKVCRDCNISFSPLSFLSLLSARSPEEYLSFDRTLAKVESSRIYHFSILSTRHKKNLFGRRTKIDLQKLLFLTFRPMRVLSESSLLIEKLFLKKKLFLTYRH